ncbi:MAG: KAP family NTPase [Actinomycetota bacterium]|nr:KAP family NTPase [Actinomycetota bacterium]
MEKAKVWAESKGGLAVWFPSPSEYEPTAFLAALSDVTAARFEQYYDKRTGRTTRAARQREMFTLLGAQGLIYAAFVLFLEGLGSRLFGGSQLTEVLNAYTFAGVLVLGGALWLFLRALTQRREDRHGLGRVRRLAEKLREEVRYIVTTKESSEFGAEAKQIGVGALLRRARERQLVERPATLSSLVHNFRAFAESMAREMDAPVVIAIDELDKMSDATKVADLLRDIKGVFEIPGVYFLVSLSDEAARSLELGAVRACNEFNSSFYTVLSLPPLDPEQAVAILRLRDTCFDEQIGRAIGVVAGGIPRGIVRVAEGVRADGGSKASFQQVLVSAVGEEIKAFLDDVLTAPSDIVAHEHGLRADYKLALWQRLSKNQKTDVGSFFDYAVGLLDEWDLNDASPRLAALLPGAVAAPHRPRGCRGTPSR